MKYIKTLIIIFLSFEGLLFGQNKIAFLFSNGLNHYNTREMIRHIGSFSDSTKYDFSYQFLPKTTDCNKENDNTLSLLIKSETIVVYGFQALKKIISYENKFIQFQKKRVIVAGINQFEYFHFREEIEKFNILIRYEKFNLQDIISFFFKLHTDIEKLYIIYDVASQPTNNNYFLKTYKNLKNHKISNKIPFNKIELIKFGENLKFKKFNIEKKQLVLNIGKIYPNTIGSEKKSDIFLWLKYCFEYKPILLYNINASNYMPFNQAYSGGFYYDIEKQFKEIITILKNQNSSNIKMVNNNKFKINPSKLIKIDPDFNKNYLSKISKQQSYEKKDFNTFSLFFYLFVFLAFIGSYLHIKKEKKKKILIDYFVKSLLLKNVLEKIQDFVIITDDEHAIVYKNKPFEQLRKNNPSVFADFITIFKKIKLNTNESETLSFKVNDHEEIYQLFRKRFTFTDLTSDVASIYSKSNTTLITEDRVLRKYLNYENSFIINFAINKSREFKLNYKYNELKKVIAQQEPQLKFFINIKQNIIKDIPLSKYLQNTASIINEYTKSYNIAFYLFDSKQNKLVYKGGFATSKNQMKAEFSIGEGTVGECFKQQKKITYLLEKNKILLNTNNIISSTGSAKPMEIHTFPLPDFKNKSLGVIEVMFHNKSNKFKLHVVEEELIPITRQIKLYDFLEKEKNNIT